MRKVLDSPWQILSIFFALTPIGQLHQSPPSPVCFIKTMLGNRDTGLFWVVKGGQQFKILFFGFLQEHEGVSKDWPHQRSKIVDLGKYLSLSHTLAHQLMCPNSVSATLVHSLSHSLELSPSATRARKSHCLVKTTYYSRAFPTSLSLIHTLPPSLCSLSLPGECFLSFAPLTHTVPTLTFAQILTTWACRSFDS